LSPGLPKFTRSITVNVSVEPIVPVVTTKNRDFELGTLENWTAVDAVISEVEPYAGSYCCELEGDGSSITQTLDNLVPMNAVWAIHCLAKRKALAGCKITIIHTDGSEADVKLQSLTTDEWTHVWTEKAQMLPTKIMSGFRIEATTAGMYIDNVAVGIATQIVSGTVEVTTNVPDPSVVNPKKYEGSVATVGVPTTLDVNDDLGHNAGDGYIVCDGPGNLEVDLSYDGSTFEEDITVKKNEVLLLGGMNIDSIKIDVTTDGTAYRVLVL